MKKLFTKDFWKKVGKKFLVFFKGWTEKGMIEYLRKQGYSVEKTK